MSKYIDADFLLDSMGKAARELDTDGMLDAMEEAMRKFYDIPAADVEPVRKWISCNERLPEDCEDVLVCGDKGVVETGYYLQELNMWLNMNESAINVRYWQPFPEPPKMDGGSE